MARKIVKHRIRQLFGKPYEKNKARTLVDLKASEFKVGRRNRLSNVT